MMDLFTTEGIIYNQFSSYIDITNNLKGLVRGALATAVAKTQPVDNGLRNKTLQTIKNNIELIEQTCTADISDKILLDTIRWSLGHEYLKLVAIYTKIKNGKQLKTPYIVDLFQLSQDEDFRVPFSDMDRMARAIGLLKGEVLFHSMSMLPEIKQFDIIRKQATWNEFIKTILRKLPTNTAGGQMSMEEAQKALEIVKPYFEGVEYDALKNA